VAAGERAIAESGADLLIADDGLQHYRLARDIEILLVDGDRGLGNRRCLPAGPLREPASRMDSVDFVLTNGGAAGRHPRMRLVPGRAVSLVDPAVTRDLAEFRGRAVNAVAAIGNPGRFFRMLRDLGIEARGHAYPDHHAFSAADVAAWPAGPVLMTEKDAVKCAAFATHDHWSVPVDAALDPDVVSGVFDRLDGLRHV
jgi:tetraacyldisaccharide 4'-kinase